MRKKILYATLCVALSTLLIGCGETDDKSKTTDSNVTTEGVSDIGSDSTEENKVESEAPQKSDIEFEDVSAMSYDDAEAYLNTLPDSSADNFKIVAYGADVNIDQYISEGECLIEEYIGSDSIVIVPEEINGYKVVGVGGKCFAMNKGLTAIRLPKTTRIICGYAFAVSQNLSIITGLDNVEIIEESSFNAGSTLRIKFTDSVKESPQNIYNGYGEIYVKKGSLMADEDHFGAYGETDASSTIQVIYY